MGLKSQKRLAASILKVGISRVWIDPNKIDTVSTAITRGEILKLIKDGTIRTSPEAGISRIRVRKGRRRVGSRKGKLETQPWVTKVRAQRKYLRTLRDKQVITKDAYRKLYRMIRGGFFETKAHLERYIETKELKK